MAGKQSPARFIPLLVTLACSTLMPSCGHEAPQGGSRLTGTWRCNKVVPRHSGGQTFEVSIGVIARFHEEGTFHVIQKGVYESRGRFYLEDEDRIRFEVTQSTGSSGLSGIVFQESGPDEQDADGPETPDLYEFELLGNRLTFIGIQSDGARVETVYYRAGPRP